MLPLLVSLVSAPVEAASFSVVGSLLRESSVDPGGTAEGWIDVRSNDDAPQSLVVSLRDYLTHADGTNDYVDPGTIARSNSAWVTFTPPRLTLEPGETQRVHYRVQVPDDLSLGGTWWSLLMIEPAVPEPEATPDGTPRVAIRTVVRYGVELVTDVGAPVAGELAFDRGQVSGPPGAATLALDVRNVGITRLAPRVWVELYDDDSVLVGRFEAKNQPGLLPVCSARYTFDLATVPPGTYTALTVADAGEWSVFGSEFTLDVR